jgi:hypothetical protein
MGRFDCHQIIFFETFENVLFTHTHVNFFLNYCPFQKHLNEFYTNLHGG